jgi:hypothetical protein
MISVWISVVPAKPSIIPDASKVGLAQAPPTNSSLDTTARSTPWFAAMISITPKTSSQIPRAMLRVSRPQRTTVDDVPAPPDQQVRSTREEV